MIDPALNPPQLVRRRTSETNVPPFNVFSTRDELKDAVDEWNRGQSGGCNTAVWKNYHHYDVTCGECAAVVNLDSKAADQINTCGDVCSRQGLACVEGWDLHKDTYKSWKNEPSCPGLENKNAQPCNYIFGEEYKDDDDDHFGWKGKALCNCTLLVHPTDAEITYGHINTWNTTGVTDMHSLFESKVGFDENISKWDTSRVTDMSRMFSVCSLPPIFSQLGAPPSPFTSHYAPHTSPHSSRNVP